MMSVGNAFVSLIGYMWEMGSKETYQISFVCYLGILLGGLISLFVMHSYMMLANLTTCNLDVI